MQRRRNVVPDPVFGLHRIVTSTTSCSPEEGARAAANRIGYVADVPTESFTHTAIAPAPAPEVFASLDEPATWEQIGGVDRVFDPVIDSEGRLRGFSFEVRAAGKKYMGSATPHERTEGELMSWHVDTTEVRGITRVALEPVDAGTAITVTLEVESKGLLSAMFFPVIASTIGSGLPRSVDEFSQRFG
jgi:hypothetical protein